MEMDIPVFETWVKCHSWIGDGQNLGFTCWYIRSLNALDDLALDPPKSNGDGII